MQPTKNNSFCFYPFYQLALKEWDKQGIKNASPCCNANTLNKDPLNLKEILKKDPTRSIEKIFNEDMEFLRQELLNNVKSDSCKTCWDLEEKTGFSYRFGSHNDWVDYKKPKLTYVDLSLGESCNLRCRMCAPGNSNQLRKDLKELIAMNFPLDRIGWFEKDADVSINERVQEPDMNSEYWKKFLKICEDLKQIKATGGETLINQPFITLLDHLIATNKAKNIRLRITTNGTKFNDAMMKRLNSFKELQITISIDGTHDVYEYIRYPMKWNKLEQSIDQFFAKSTNLSNAQIVCVVQWCNVWNIPELINWYKKYPNVVLGFDPVQPYGRALDICWLDRKNMKLLHGVLSPMVEAERVVKLIEYNLNNYKFNPQKVIEAREELVAFDKIRNQDYVQILNKNIVRLLQKY